ncbi:hypothetical protein JB92DRAFT_3106276 [Gautieria morchelliformis]|nr:hypothetical protein JB92DRAFT_3106276 [Gautieria morchelliformis]
MTVEELSSEDMDGVADEVGEDEQGRMSELLLSNAKVPGDLLTMGFSYVAIVAPASRAWLETSVRLTVANVAVAGRGGWLDPTHCCGGESDMATHTGPDSIGDSEARRLEELAGCRCDVSG